MAGLTEEWQGETLYVLRRESGAEAKIALGIGANCLRLVLHGHTVIESPQAPDYLRAHPAREGVPILFPFPNRVADAQYTFNGTTYHLPRTESHGVHHIHGFVMRHPWRLVEQDTARLVCAFDSATLEAHETEGYPFPFTLSVAFDLGDDALTLHATVANTGTGPLPFGFGLHPYLLAADSITERATLHVHVPAGRVWLAQDGIPTGETAAAAGENDLRSATDALGGRAFDTYYTDAARDGSDISASIANPTTGVTVTVRADASFRDWVVFTPPTLPSVALEPYTCAPDAVNLEPRGIDAGLRVLAPGQSWQGQVQIGVSG